MNFDDFDSQLEEYIFEIKHKTGLAFLVSDGSNDYWLPMSKIDWHEPDEIGDTTTFYIPNWLAEEKEII